MGLLVPAIVTETRAIFGAGVILATQFASRVVFWRGSTIQHTYLQVLSFRHATCEAVPLGPREKKRLVRLLFPRLT
jgi:hypothetical protein